MTLKSTGEPATRTPTPAATTAMCASSATCWPRIPQMERVQPDPSELVIVLTAPAPGVKEMSAPAATSVSHRDQDTGRVYGPSRRSRSQAVHRTGRGFGPERDL